MEATRSRAAVPGLAGVDLRVRQGRLPRADGRHRRLRVGRRERPLGDRRAHHGRPLRHRLVYALRGNRVARIVLAALAVIGGVTAIVFAFIGPTSAILPSITTAVLAAIVIWLLYGLRSSNEYFGT